MIYIAEKNAAEEEGVLASRLPYITGWYGTASRGRGLCAQMQEVMQLATQGPLGKSTLGRGDGECKGPGDGVLGLFKESRGARVSGKE